MTKYFPQNKLEVVYVTYLLLIFCYIKFILPDMFFYSFIPNSYFDSISLFIIILSKYC